MFSQIYIFSVNIQNSTNTKTFSYPFLKFLRVKRSKNNYIQILNFCKKIYQEKFNCDLQISTFHCDAEIAFILAAQFVFPDCQIMLCSVHLIRTFQKNYVKKVSGDFHAHPILLYVWKVLCGSIFIDLKNVEIISELRIFFLNQKEKLDENLKNSFQVFLDYLDKFFRSDAIFNPSLFDFFDAIVMRGYCTTSTNCLETINKQLKSAAGAGLLTLNSTCRVIRDFKISYLKLHERCIVKGKLNRQRPLPLQREKNLTEILSNFSDLDSENQVKKVIDTCFEIGNLTKTIKSSNILKRQKNLIPVITTEEDLELDLISADESSSDEN